MALSIHQPSWFSEFRSFILRGNVVDLAVGIIIGAAFTSIVSSLVEDIFNPVIGLLIGGIDFSNLFITLRGEHLPSLAQAKQAGAVTLNVGVFINAVIKFVIVAFAVFWVVKLLGTMTRKEPPKPIEPTKSELLLAEIRDELRNGRGAAPMLTSEGPTPIPRT